MDGVESRRSQRPSRPCAVRARHIRVGDNRATLAQPKSGAVPAKVGQQAWPDLYLVTARAQLDVNDSHGPRISGQCPVSKV
jgi:hypothetical protein